ncbi:Na+/H+ antiporter NhaA [uncultured Pleomorphomonas sp.]|nr:Na+/H+ antiporter NhaA [uncultured Pleomorphomonas sp.]
MNRLTPGRKRPRAQILAERAFATLERFLHVEAVSGIVLLAAAAIALVWANSPLAESYHHLWHVSFSVGLGEFKFDRPLHFWINDALMTVFFLVVGMEIRREIHDGALSDLRQASLPIAAAVGGVAAPALIYLALNSAAPQARGWAVPTATDIAFFYSGGLEYSGFAVVALGIGLVLLLQRMGIGSAYAYVPPGARTFRARPSWACCSGPSRRRCWGSAGA